MFQVIRWLILDSIHEWTIDSEAVAIYNSQWSLNHENSFKEVKASAKFGRVRYSKFSVGWGLLEVENKEKLTSQKADLELDSHHG